MAILLLSHPSLSGMASGTGQSGSTGWGNSVRSRLYLERPKAQDGGEPDPDLRILTNKKANFSSTDVSLSLRWAAGAFRLEKSGLGGLDRMAQERAADTRFLELLADFEKQGRTTNNAGGPNYAPRAFAASDSAIGKDRFRGAMERLFR
jgi:RecA-family ATPase